MQRNTLYTCVEKDLGIYMVNSISSNMAISTANIKQENTEKLIKYVKGESLTQAPDTFKSNLKSSTTSMALFEGLPVLKYFKNNKLVNKAAKGAMQTLDARNVKAFQNVLKGEGKLTSRLVNFVQTANDSKKAFTGIKSATKAQAKAVKTAKAAEKAVAKATAKNTVKTTAKAAKAAAKAETAAAKAAATQITADVAKTTSKFGKIGKFMKSSGAGIVLAFSGICEGVTEVIPTFKELGKEKGVKQLGKSAVKVAGDTIGFVAGEQIGTAIGVAAGSALAGTKIGAAIGSVVPGAGTIIGALVGCVGGMLGSWAMGKVTKAITGKSEREIAKEEQEKQQAQQIANDNDSLESLKQEALAKIQAEQEAGELSEDSKLAYAAIIDLENTNPFAA